MEISAGADGADGANGGTDIVNLGGSVDTTPQLGGALASNGNNINFADGDRLVFGAGADLQIFHTGTTSKIRDGGTGNLVIEGNEVYIVNVLNSETMARFTPDGAAELYYDNAKKLETTSTGVDVTGLTDTDTLNVSSTSAFASTVTITPSSDVKGLIIDGSNATTENNAQIVLKGNGPQAIDFRDSSNVNGIRLVYRTGPNEWKLEKSESSNYNFIVADRDDGRVDLYYGGSKKFETTSSGVEVTGTVDTDALTVSGTSTFQSHVYLGDSDNLYFGDGEDMRILHNGTDSFIIDQGTGKLKYLWRQ